MLPVWSTSMHTRQLAKEAELVQHCRTHKKPKTLLLRFLSQQKHMSGLPMISSDLLTKDPDQHPLPPPPVKTHVSAIQLTPKIRSHLPKTSASRQDGRWSPRRPRLCFAAHVTSSARRKLDGILAPLGRMFEGIDHIFRFIHKSPHF